jgi:Asp-tRNA(Asn)/Glu-tRNA(Gln) amidotransferase C subunit
MSKAKEIQLSFLSKVKQALPANVSLVDELAELLNTSNDSAYRRMRGETLLSIDEIDLICSHFKVSFDTHSNSESNSGTVTFNYFKIEGKAENFKQWLSGLRNNVKQIEEVEVPDFIPEYNHKNQWREDVISEKEFDGDSIIAQFPDKQDGFLKVKKIL